MSFREEKYLSFKQSDVIPKLDYLEELPADEFHNLFLEVLYSGVHGFSFSMYEDGQKPDDLVTEEQISRRIDILNTYSGWVRSFATTHGHEMIPAIAKKKGMKTLVGAWLGEDHEENQKEIDNLVKLAKVGLVDVAAVGNEVLYREEMSEEKLISYINQVKEMLPNIPVGYVDAYYEFVLRPDLTEACDLVLCNCYPFWEGTSIEDSFQHLRQMYHDAKQAGNGKRVIITETGWPSKGETLGKAEPSKFNAMTYFINTFLWANDENIEVFYFSSFDESWKVSAEGEVGAYWGVWDKFERLKY